MAGKSLFSCRIVDITSYTVAPVKDLDVCYSEFRSSAVAKVPVVRIFGSTPTGQKTCLHVHGVFPYIYVPCPVADPSNGYLQQLARGIDQALQVSLGVGSKSDQHHVFKITVVKGIPMYGYHDNEELFLKIYLYNPVLVKRLSDLLVAGALMGTVLQPHESHIPFVLQFMIDYNLYGMNFIHFSSIKFRPGRDSSNRSSPARSTRSGSFSSPPLLSPPFSPPHSSSSPSTFPSSLVPTPSQQVWDVDNLPGSMMVCAPRASESELEVDGLAADVLNRQQLSLACGGFPGLAAIWEEERQRRRQLGLSPTLTPPSSPDRVPHSTQPSELRTALDSIMEERLGKSVSPVESSPPSSSSSVPWSCDTQSHRPIRSMESDPQMVARRLSLDCNENEGEGLVVDEVAIHQTMELSQRLNIETLRKSTDEELLDLMLELAQTQVGMGTQLSQSLYQTPTVAVSLSSRLKKSVSTPTSHHSGPCAPLPFSSSQPVGDTSTAGSPKTSLTSTQPVLNTSRQTGGVTSMTVEEDNDVMDWQEAEDVDTFFVTGEDLLNKSDEIDPASKTSIAATSTEVCTTQPDNSQHTTQALKVTPAPLEIAVELPLTSPQSPVFSDNDLFDAGFPLDPTLPPSPPHELVGNTGGVCSNRDFSLEFSLEGENEKNLSVMLNSSAIRRNGENQDDINGSPEFESEFDIPCAQPPSSLEQLSSPSDTQGSLYRGTNESAADISGSLNSVEKPHSEGFTAEGGRSVDVQLEYEMPEISLSQFEAFQSTTAEILGTPSKMTSTRKEGLHDILLIGSQIPSSQPPRSCISSEGNADDDDDRWEQEGILSEQQEGVNKGIVEGDVGVKEETVGVKGGTVRVNEATVGVKEGGFDELLPTTLRKDLSPITCDVVPSGIYQEKQISTPFGKEVSPNQEREMDEVVTDTSLICLSSSQRRALLLQLCSTEAGELMSSSEDEGKGLCSGSVSESEAEEERKWMSGQGSSVPQTIPESPQDSCERLGSGSCISQQDGHIGFLDSNISQMDECVSQLDGTPDEPKKRRPKKKTLELRRKARNPQKRTAKEKTAPDKPSTVAELVQEDQGGRKSSGVAWTEVVDMPAEPSKETAVLHSSDWESGEHRMERLAEPASSGVGSDEQGAMEGPEGASSGVGSDEQRAMEGPEGAVKRWQEQERGRPKKAKLSLSLKSGSRKRRRSRKLPSSPLQVAHTLLQSASGINSHPLASQWKSDALKNPPRVCIPRGQVFQLRAKDNSACVSYKEMNSETPHSTLNQRSSKRKKERRKIVPHRIIGTRWKEALLSQRYGKPVSEKDQLEWAIRESQRNSHETTISDATSASSAESSLQKNIVERATSSTSVSDRRMADEYLLSDSESTLSASPSEYLQKKNSETTLSASVSLLEVISDPEHREKELFSAERAASSTSVSDRRTADEYLLSDSESTLSASPSESESTLSASPSEYLQKKNSETTLSASVSLLEVISDPEHREKELFSVERAASSTSVSDRWTVDEYLLSDSESTLSASPEYLQKKNSETTLSASVSLLEVISDPEQREKELSSADSPDKMDVDVSPSESSSQDIESDFNLVMTESESESDERVVLRKPVGKRKKKEKCGDIMKMNTTRSEVCTVPRSSITLGEKLSPFDPRDLSGSMKFGEGREIVEGSVSIKATSSEKEMRTLNNMSSLMETGPLQKMEVEQVPSLPPLQTLRHLKEPPTAAQFSQSAASYGLPHAVHTRPFYSNPSDVQPPKEVNRKLVRIPSRMPYDLHEAEPPILAEGGPLSATGTQHWRTVLSMLSGASQSTEMLQPPLCHPPQEPKMNQLSYYSAEDHKHNVKLRSTFFPATEVFLTPIRDPPHSRKVKRWILPCKSPQRKMFGTAGTFATKSAAAMKDCGSIDPTSVSVSISDRSCTEGTPVIIESETERESKSPASAGSESIMQSDQELPSFTSYQLPKRIADSETAIIADDEAIQTENKTRTVDSQNQSVLSEPACIENLQDRNALLSNNERGMIESGGERTAGVIETESESENRRVGQRDECEASESGLSPPVRQKDGDVLVSSARPMNLSFTPASLKRDTSQLEGPTPQNTYGFKISPSAFAISSDTHEYLTSMSVELHIRTRGDLRPDPEWDPVLTIFYYIHHDYPHSNPGEHSKKPPLGVIAIDIQNSGFQAVHTSKQIRGKQSPRKRPIRSSEISPRQQLPITSLAKSPKKRPIKSPDNQVSLNEATKQSQKTADGGCVPGDSGVQSLRTLNYPVVAKGYLSGCVSGDDVEVKYVSSEGELLEELVTTVRRHDPDILLGYEVTMTSWGYLIDRAATLNVNLTNQLSRVPYQPGNKPNSERVGSGTGTRHQSSSQVHIPGRILVNVWRLLRKELSLTSYSFESTYFQVMHHRIPMFPFQSLTQWYETGTHANRAEVVEYYLLRCHGNYQLLQKLNVIGRTSEFARLYGIEFENVLSRGSQYRVESMLLRLVKPANYIAVSPSIQQRARMAAPECLPLILEPESKFYTDPVVVLDFQSLYPSIIIGYNYCYTTCLGRVRNLALHGDFTFGTNSLNIPPHLLKKVKKNVSISPNGVVFVTPSIRRGFMPRMLEEILGTRIMVKGSMKLHKQDKALIRMLDARQMGLKLIANVTYGYTAANFSGRMPCVEVADSIVGKARETLERAINLITETPEWGARVVYGATDSVFVLLKGASKDDAFRIGKEICDRVTADNPKPVKLKFEKVYYPCILQTKSRYCGYMYETPDQSEPCYDAKGIETVRRDTCPAVAKILQKSLSLLFSSRDVSQVKSYVQRQCRKLLDGHVSLQDYILAKEYRGSGNYRPGACVPALELTRRAVESDPRAEPRPGERVPYVVVYGHPGQPLIQLVRSPLEVTKDSSLRLNGVYYITKQVLPALDRALSLLGVDVYQWYNELPRTFRAPLPQIPETTNRKLKGTLGQYFATMHCPVCDELTADTVCSRCRGNPQRAATMLSQHICELESAHHSVTMLCQSCTRTTDPSISSECVSLDCPVFYRRLHTLHTLPTVTTLTKLLHTTLSSSQFL